MSSSDSSTQSLVDRVQSFISENRRAVLIGTAAAVVAVGGAAYYASTSRGPDDDSERRKKKGSSSKKRKTVKDKDGPLLEERSPKVADEAGMSRSARFMSDGRVSLTAFRVV